MSVSATQILKTYWGFEHFLYPQEEIILSVLQGKDTFASLPTGGGKSLCFQIPILMQEGLCLVISPLIALMKDQVKNLKSKGIKAELLSSELTRQEINVLIDNCRFGGVKLLYVSPERLNAPNFIEILTSLNIRYIAVDEAHCISEWGHDFRPAYLDIKNIRTLLPETPILALTASATPMIQQEILNQLEMDDAQIFKKSLQRKNIAYRIENTENKLEELVSYLYKFPEAAIVFCRSRKETYEVAEYLKEKGFDADFFHAKIPIEEKNRKQKAFIESERKILVSTNAFGMGIDKPNVRLVVHLHAPSSIESYFQEVGRAGRDGKLATGILLYHNKDKKNAITQFKSNTSKRGEFTEIIKKLYDFFEIGEGEFPKNQKVFSEKKFRKRYELSKRKTRNILLFMEQSKLIKIHKSQRQSLVKLQLGRSEITDKSTAEDRVLSYLARHYGGIFQEPKPVDEFLISRRLNLSAAMLKEILKSLNQSESIYYRDATMVKISFLEPRENNRIQIEYWKKYKQYQQLKFKRLQEMYFFVEHNEKCKSRMLLSYFGEKHTAKCGHCNVCKAQISADVSPQIVLEKLENAPYTLDELNRELAAYDHHSIATVLQILLDEEKIKFTYPDLYQFRR